MKAADLIGIFQTMYKEHWAYIWGHAETGCVDCSGAFVYAYKTLDHKSIAHGSNAIARKYVGDMLPISKAQPGMAAFKAKQPGEDGYDLPERYKPGGASYNEDLNDYYHIGLVDEDPRYVLNAKSTQAGFCRDGLTAKNGWDFVALLKDVDYDNASQDEEVTHMQAKVVLPSGASGSTVNMRQRPETSAPLICRVPVSEEVDIISDQGAWCRIESAGLQGWMMSNYLEYIGQDGESGGDQLTPEDRERIEDALQMIEKQIDEIRGILGRG